MPPNYYNYRKKFSINECAAPTKKKVGRAPEKNGIASITKSVIKFINLLKYIFICHD